MRVSDLSWSPEKTTRPIPPLLPASPCNTGYHAHMHANMFQSCECATRSTLKGSSTSYFTLHGQPAPNLLITDTGDLDMLHVQVFRCSGYRQSNLNQTPRSGSPPLPHIFSNLPPPALVVHLPPPPQPSVRAHGQLKVRTRPPEAS